MEDEDKEDVRSRLENLKKLDLKQATILKGSLGVVIKQTWKDYIKAIKMERSRSRRVYEGELVLSSSNGEKRQNH